jgi:beta-N-acetylhexosaminidase
MEMKAIADNTGTVVAVVEAVKAGADMVLVSHTAELQRGAVAALRQAIASGEIPASRVEEALVRIEQARRRAAQAAPPHVDTAAHAALAARIAAAAVTLVRDRGELLPLAPQGLGAVVCKPAALSRAEEAAAAPLCASLLRTLAPDCEVLVVDREPTPEEVAAAMEMAGRSRSMVVATYVAAGSAAQVGLVRAVLAANPRTAVLAQRNPYDFQALPEAGTGVVAYEDRPLMLEAAIRVLLGQQSAAGTLPITL